MINRSSNHHDEKEELIIDGSGGGGNIISSSNNNSNNNSKSKMMDIGNDDTVVRSATDDRGGIFIELAPLTSSTTVPTTDTAKSSSTAATTISVTTTNTSADGDIKIIANSSNNDNNNNNLSGHERRDNSNNNNNVNNFNSTKAGNSQRQHDHFDDHNIERVPLCSKEENRIHGNACGVGDDDDDDDDQEKEKHPECTTLRSSSNNNNNNNSSLPFTSFSLLFSSPSSVPSRDGGGGGGGGCSRSNNNSNTISSSTSKNNNTMMTGAEKSSQHSKNDQSTATSSSLLPPSSTTKTPTVPFSIAAATVLGSIQEERGDEDDEDQDYTNPEPIMNVMDYLEDEIDEHTYDEIIPLQLRMALEDAVFGWDHFLSSLLGHVGYTVGSYLITFWLITFVVLHEVPWGSSNISSSSSGGYYDSGRSGGGTTGGGGGGNGIIHKNNNPWGMPHELFSILRTSLAIASAISTFRTIRRRRRVWLRHPSSSRQQELLLEADQRARRFVLGSELWSRMRKSYAKRRDRYLARKVHRKLLGAQRMFEKRHRNRMKLIRSVSASSLLCEDGGVVRTTPKGTGSASVSGGESTLLSSSENQERSAAVSALTRHDQEKSHHERVRILASSPGIVPPRDDDTTMSMGGGSSVDGGSGSIGFSADERHRYHPRSHNYRHHHRDSHTLPNFAMESVSHDQMPFAHGEIKKIPYVHGGFFGAAPFMLTNPHWIAILRLLMPDVYVEISRRASYAAAPRLIHWAENNPVVAAYGTAHELEFSGKVPTLEWDVFLDPHLVRRVEIVLSEKEAFLQRQKDARRASQNDQNLEESTADGATTETSALHHHNAPLISATDERLVLSYYDKEIKRRTTILVDRMLIAHGNMVQLVLEQTGYLKRYNFSRVKRTRKTLGGGIFARQWLAVYSEAMKLGMGYDEDDGAEDDDIVSDSGTESSLEEREEFADFSQSNNGNDLVGDGRLNDSLPRDQRSIIIPDLKSSAQSQDTTSDAHRTPSPQHSDEDYQGPPRKIIMMRSSNNDENDEGLSNDCDEMSIRSEPSPCKSGRSTPRRNASGKKRRRRGRSMTSPPIMERMAAATSLHLASTCPDKSITESISMLKPIMRSSAPFSLVLDMKSRHVSRRVWALIVDFLRDAGARVEGVASFFVEEVRDITQYCNCSVNEFVFTHSAGDIQHGCHSGKIKRGDRVFFNAGSLLWDYPDVCDVDVLKNILRHRFHPFFDEQGIKEGYRLKPYARIIRKSSSRVSPPISSTTTTRRRCDSETETYCDESTLDDGDESMNSDLFTRLLIADTKKKSLSEVDFVYEETADGTCCSTIQEYKDFYQLSLGVYVQEFAIDEVAISLIVKYVNSNSHVYDMGLSWGGINGLTVRGIQPGRFTATDGFWNQRYGGKPWRKECSPAETPS